MDAYYVYVYKEDDDVVYIGMGQKGRAWHCGYMQGDTKERHNWKEEQMGKGRLPCDWVTVVERGLSKGEALELEELLIKETAPKLNQLHNPDYDARQIKLDLAVIKQLREDDTSYRKIAKQLGVSPMTVYRQFNNVRQTKLATQHRGAY